MQIRAEIHTLLDEHRYIFHKERVMRRDVKDAAWLASSQACEELEALILLTYILTT